MATQITTLQQIVGISTVGEPHREKPVQLRT
jgi:hypothetical protein